MSKSVAPSLATRIREGLLRRWRRLSISIAGRSGRYEHLRTVDWARVERLVFVCSGNICRSPFAEHIALAKNLDAVSCGTTARSGAPGDPVAIETAEGFGVDLSKHASRHVSEVEFSASDLVVVMDLHHLAAVGSVADAVGAQMTLLGLWDGAQPVTIFDPFGCSAGQFELCFRRIAACMDTMTVELER